MAKRGRKKGSTKKTSKAKAPTKKEEPEKKKSKFEVDFEEDIGEQLGDFLQETEPDNIFGMYGSPDHSLGVMKTIYSNLPNMEKIIAIKRDTNVYGMPLNKMFELYGVEASGKTTLAKYLCCRYVALGGLAFFVDFEHKFDPVWLRAAGNRMGLSEKDYKRFKYVDPAERAFEWFIVWLLQTMKRVSEIRNTARSNMREIEYKKRKSEDDIIAVAKLQTAVNIPIIVVIDSIAGIYTQAEVNDEEENKVHVAELARAFAKSLKHIRRILGSSNTTILWLNQERHKIAMGGQKVRPGSMVTPGGTAVKHFVDGRFRIARIGALKRTRDSIERVYGAVHTVTCTKNQMGIPPFINAAQLHLLYDRGYDSFFSVLEACVEVGIIKKKGSRYCIPTGNSKIEFEKTEIDELENGPRIQKALHKIYQKYMEERK
jgi:RecA/RadA recombinase